MGKGPVQNRKEQLMQAYGSSVTAGKGRGNMGFLNAAVFNQQSLSKCFTRDRSVLLLFHLPLMLQGLVKTREE